MHGFHRFFVDSQTQWLDHARVGDVALRVNHDPEHHDSLVLGFAGFFGVGRLGLVDRDRRADSATYAVDAAAGAAVVARPKASAVPGSDSTPRTGPNSTPRTRSVRRWSRRALWVAPREVGG